MEQMCQRYMAEIGRVYGQATAEASECRSTVIGGFWVRIAPEEDANYYTKAEMERMITILSQRKPLKGV
ncbi:MAG: hypothetical protein ABIH46_05965 [Chloroflexota bacterium]